MAFSPQYLELRYESAALRKVGTLIILANLSLYMGMCLYAPSLTLSAVTNISTFASMAIICSIVTFYSTIVSTLALYCLMTCWWLDAVDTFLYILSRLLPAETADVNKHSYFINIKRYFADLRKFTLKRYVNKLSGKKK